MGFSLKGKTHTPFLANPLTGDVELLFLCLNGESSLSLEIWFLQFCLVFKSFPIIYPKKFFYDRCHLQPCRFCVLYSPGTLVFILLFWKPATKWQDCFKPHSAYWGNLSLWECPLPNWKLECLSKHPRASVSFLPPLPLYPPDIFQAM